MCRSLGRGDRDQGAAAVEFALLMPLLFMLVMGMIDYGLWFNDSLSVRQGVRESARQAVVRHPYASPCAGLGMAAVACDTRSEIGKPGAPAYAKVVVENGQWVRGNKVLVCGMIKATSFTGFVPMPDGGLIKSKTTMSIESLTPSPITIEAQDTAPSGFNWSWCTLTP